MATLIQKIARLAGKTFSVNSQDHVFQDRFRALIQLANEVKGRDLNFRASLVEERGADEAPVTYIHLWEDAVFTMSVFVLRGTNGRIPLHDHPGMYGLCKVIHGSVQVESYDERAYESPPSELRSRQEALIVKSACRRPLQRLGVDDDCCVLTPTRNNIHEISSYGGPAAFLDILAPPYDQASSARRCHYYKELPTDQSGGTPVFDSVSDLINRWLVETAQPVDYWCDAAEYEGPEILL